MNVRIDPSWNKELQDEWDKPYFAELTDFVRQQYQDSRQIVYPLLQEFLRLLMNVLLTK